MQPNPRKQRRIGPGLRNQSRGKRKKRVRAVGEWSLLLYYRRVVPWLILFLSLSLFDWGLLPAGGINY